MPSQSMHSPQKHELSEESALSWYANRCSSSFEEAGLSQFERILSEVMFILECAIMSFIFRGYVVAACRVEPSFCCCWRL